MNQELSQDQLQKIVDDHVSQLLENFDSVTIMVTSHDGASGETSGYDGGGGDFYARLAKAQEWLRLQDHHVNEWLSRKAKKSK